MKLIYILCILGLSSAVTFAAKQTHKRPKRDLANLVGYCRAGQVSRPLVRVQVYGLREDYGESAFLNSSGRMTGDSIGCSSEESRATLRDGDPYAGVRIYSLSLEQCRDLVSSLSAASTAHPVTLEINPATCEVHTTQ